MNVFLSQFEYLLSISQSSLLQVYRSVFGCFINAFKTYEPLLSAVKKEYENTLGW